MGYRLNDGWDIHTTSPLTNNNRVGLKVYGHMMTSSNGDNFCVTGPLWGESTCHWWIPLTMASEAELCCFLWFALPKQTVERTIGMPVIWDAIMLIMSLKWHCLNSLVSNFKNVIFRLLQIDIMSISHENVLMWMKQNLLLISQHWYK